MKIKGFVIAGIIFVILGIGLCIFAASLEGFKIDSTYEQKNLEIGEVNSIRYDGSQDNLIIVPASDDKTHLNYYENNLYKYDINYNELTKELVIIQKGHHFFSIGNQNNNFKIEVYGLVNNLDIDTNAGNIEVKYLDISNINIDLDAGNITLKNMNINKLYCNIDAGSFDSTNINSSTVNIDLDAGNILYDGKILTSFIGDIDVGDCILKLSQNSDEFIINDIGNGTIVINYDLDLGDFDIIYK